MNTYTIDKDVPIPVTPKISGRAFLGELEVGDSFFIPGGNNNSWQVKKIEYGKKTGKKFTLRTLKENGVKGIRIWRTA